MKKNYFLLLALGLFTGVNAQIINFPDVYFKSLLLTASTSNMIAQDLTGNYFKVDANSDGEIQQNEALAVSLLNVNNLYLTDLTGIGYFVNLTTLDCSNSQLSSLNMSSNNALTTLNCYNNVLTSLNVSSNTALTTLNCYYNGLSSLNVSSNTALTSLVCSNNNLTSLNVSNNTALITLDCNSNDLTGLNISSNLALEYLDCSSNALGSLNVNSNSALTTLKCNSTQLTSLNVSNNLLLSTLNCGGNALTSLNLSSNTALKFLYCYSNGLTSLNMSNNLLLTNLDCSNNNLTSLNVSNNAALSVLWCYYNQLTNLDVSGCTTLNKLRCQYNQLTSLSLGNSTALNELICDYNQLSSLNVSSNTGLTSFGCSNNLLTSLNVSSNTLLGSLGCSYNLLMSLNVSNNTVLTSLACNNNQLTSMFIKNGKNETINFSQNPNLQYICADEGQLVDIQNKITTYIYTNCHVNSYCSFTPGGAFYTIQGNQKLDSNNNGCDVMDIVYPNLKFNITNGINLGKFISNTTGNYSIPVIAGTHIVTPAFENPTYFTTSPSTVNVTFPTQASPLTQNFCITANGVHPDLEVVLLPITGARPGFDSSYKLIYKNKGNTTQSGTVNLIFNDAVLDFVSASPVISSQSTNNLSWNFTNLLPFETREIEITFNVNSPVETPAVNGGDILNYTATITSAATDDMPNDNTFVLCQTVVNSFDPNDKTCLEGATISPSKVGDYVHYMIRFENNGTANAQNIVVKDMIDLTKFDINSLVPMKGSHSFVTNITSGNKVEFIFQNINLPFDNANNDGYVAFKIKTKPTLVLGNTFSNTASIYFDYNFPIVTNMATTTIAVLGRQDFEFADYFNVYPNPVSDVLNISSTAAIEVSSINIYNTLGQLVLVIPNAKDIKTVDVSDLAEGNYFIKIHSDKGVSNTKFIKN